MPVSHVLLVSHPTVSSYRPKCVTGHGTGELREDPGAPGRAADTGPPCGARVSETWAEGHGETQGSVPYRTELCCRLCCRSCGSPGRAGAIVLEPDRHLASTLCRAFSVHSQHNLLTDLKVSADNRRVHRLTGAYPPFQRFNGQLSNSGHWAACYLQEEEAFAGDRHCSSCVSRSQLGSPRPACPGLDRGPDSEAHRTPGATLSRVSTGPTCLECSSEEMHLESGLCGFKVATCPQPARRSSFRGERAGASPPTARSPPRAAIPAQPWGLWLFRPQSGWRGRRPPRSPALGVLAFRLQHR